MSVWIARDGVPKAIIKRKYENAQELLSSLNAKELSAKDVIFSNIISELAEIPEGLVKDEDFMIWLTSFIMKKHPYI